MMVLALVVCLMGIRSSCGVDAQQPYSISCKNETSATVIVKSGYSLSATQQGCNLQQISGANQQLFRLNTNCLNNVTLIVEKTPAMPTEKFLTREERYGFTITCKKKDQDVYTVNTQIQFGSNLVVKPEVVKFTPESDYSSRLIVLNILPSLSQSVQELTSSALISAQLEDALFLTIVDEKKTGKFMKHISNPSWSLRLDRVLM